LESLDIISMNEFVSKIAKPGLLGMQPPANRSVGVDWTIYDKINAVTTCPYVVQQWIRDHDGLWQYLEHACHTRAWEPGKFFWAFNVTKDKKGFPVFGNVEK
jgi:hypothetical protein